MWLLIAFWRSKLKNITVNTFAPNNYIDSTKDINPEFLDRYKKIGMHFLKMYNATNTDPNHELYVHLTVHNNFLNLNLKNYDINNIFSQFRKTMYGAINNKDTMNKALNDTDFNVNLNNRLDSSQGERYISDIFVFEYRDKNNNLLYKSLCDMQVVYICGTCFNLYSYCNFIEGHLEKL